MDELENKLGQILGNPEMMGQIMAMAQSFGNQEPASSPEPAQAAVSPELDAAAIRRITGLLSQTGVDKKQQALLSALSPYISSSRVSKLEKAMRAAKLAGIATSFLGSTSLFSGR